MIGLISTYSLNLWRKIKENTVELEMRKNQYKSRRKQIESCYKKTYMRVQFILEIFEPRQK